jgi:hypothetical protein
LKTSLALPDDLWEAAKARGIRDRKSLAGVIVDALRAHLGMPERKERRKEPRNGKKG